MRKIAEREKWHFQVLPPQGPQKMLSTSTFGEIVLRRKTNIYKRWIANVHTSKLSGQFSIAKKNEFFTAVESAGFKNSFIGAGAACCPGPKCTLVRFAFVYGMKNPKC